MNDATLWVNQQQHWQNWQSEPESAHTRLFSMFCPLLQQNLYILQPAIYPSVQDCPSKWGLHTVKHDPVRTKHG